MSRSDEILKVVHSFYEKARYDILIGYHFRNISHFDEHIPRIAQFWEVQLLGSTAKKIDPPFDVLKAHLPLLIKRGELDRWLLLFRKTLDEHESELGDFKKIWLEKLIFFEAVFTRSLGF
jgi:truncated hemoglobin YjbI